MNWGVTSMLFEGHGSDDEMLRFAIDRGTALAYLEPGDIVLVTHGVDHESGSTSLIKVMTVEAATAAS